MKKEKKYLWEKRFYIKVAFHIFLPLVLGTLIYIFWRKSTIIYKALNIFPNINVVKISSWIKYNLPDGLWLYALLSTVIFIWRDNYSGYFILWILLTLTLCFLSEIFQKLHVIPGNFDWNDIIAYTTAFVFFYFFNYQYINKSIIINVKTKTK